MGKDGSVITEVDPVESIKDNSNDDTQIIRNAKIVGVQQLDSYRACLRCNARVEPLTPPLGRCSSCAMLQTYSVCTEHLSAKLMFMTSPQNMVTLSAFGHMVKQLISAEDKVCEEMFLKTNEFSSITYNENNIITDIVQ